MSKEQIRIKAVTRTDENWPHCKIKWLDIERFNPESNDPKKWWERLTSVMTETEAEAYVEQAGELDYGVKSIDDIVFREGFHSGYKNRYVGYRLVWRKQRVWKNPFTPEFAIVSDDECFSNITGLIGLVNRSNHNGYVWELSIIRRQYVIAAGMVLDYVMARIRDRNPQKAVTRIHNLTAGAVKKLEEAEAAGIECAYDFEMPS